MTLFKENFFSVVILGQMNPAILNHDFLVDNDIIPKTVQPFSVFLQKKPGEQFSEFVSTPVISSIKYEQYSILVEQQRLQVTDETGNNPVESPIPDMTKRYFEVLEYTPVRLGGFNFKGTLQFEDTEGEKQLDAILGINRDKTITLTSSDQARVSLQIRWPYQSGIILLRVDKPKDHELSCFVHFNFEFKYEKELSEFLRYLDLVGQYHDEFMRILTTLETR